MQRKGNAVRVESQSRNLETFGIDMGGNLWATSIYDWETGKSSYYGLKDKDDKSKEERVFELVKDRIKQGKQVDVFYEAGRYGYWPARKFQDIGAHVHILPINKLKVIMCGKVVKTDKLDAQFLGGLHPSDKLPEVYIPSLEEESRRDGEREQNRLNTSIKRVNAQMIALIERTPLPTPKCHKSSVTWRRHIVKWMKTPEWNECPKLLLLRLQNMVNELEFLEKQAKEWDKIIEKQMARDECKDKSGNGDKSSETIKKLHQFKGVGEVISRHFSWEIGDFTRFTNGNRFAAYFGLTPCPYASGTMNRDQGISKSGRKSLRKMAIECAWLWYQWQKNSWLVKKWKDRLEQKGRIRRTAIVAMARQLMVALWRYVVHGEMIEGAIMNKPIQG